jgi:NADH dehydrogenase FAD-containing subunit
MKKKLVVVGGGFAGAKIASKLQKKFDVILIDDKDYYEFTPGILRCIVNPSHLKKIQVRHKNYLKKGSFIKAGVVGVAKNCVILDNKKRVNFDYLAIASGSKYASPMKEKGMVLAQRGEELKEYHGYLEKAKRIIVIGGGLVGVELSAEIIENYPGKKISIVKSGDRLIPNNSPKSAEYARKFLEQKGVEVIYNQKDAEEMRGDLFFYCKGIKPNSEFLQEKFLDERGFVKVNDFLQIDNMKNVFACGDVASLKEEKLAQGAEKQAKIAIKNLKRMLAGRKLKKYVSKKRSMVISLGRRDGILEWKSLALYGKLSAAMKWLVEKKTMIRYDKV